jgi:hypothetical protein
MASQLPPDPPLVAHAEDEPLIFFGPPGAIRGAIRLHNASAESLRLDDVAIEAAELRGPGRVPLQRARLGARLQPGEQAAAPLELQADPTTPPGSYEISLQLGETRRKATVYVTEHAALRLQPAEVFLYTDGEQTFQREFVAENVGNVPLRLGARCLVRLADPQEFQLALQEGLKGAGDQPWEDTARNVLGALERQQVGYLTITREEVTLQPGETRSGTVTFELPGKLQRFHRYVADWGGYGASTRIHVYVAEPARPETPTRGRGKQ